MRKQLVPRPSNDPAVVFEAHELGHIMFDAAALLEELDMQKQKQEKPDKRNKRRKLIKSADVLELVPVHRNTINRLVKQNKFPKPVWLGGQRFWYEDEVNEWLAHYTTYGPIAPPWHRK
jgi:predicted DNA-binding transcriptional regulator AlpA